MSEKDRMRRETLQAGQRRPLNPWVRDHLMRSIWKEEAGTRSLRFCPVKEVEGKQKTISIHMGRPLLGESIEVLNLSVRSFNCLRRCGIETIDDLMERISSEEDLLRIRNLGRKSAEEILEKLEAYQKILMENPAEKREKKVLDKTALQQ